MLGLFVLLLSEIWSNKNNKSCVISRIYVFLWYSKYIQKNKNKVRKDTCFWWRRTCRSNKNVLKSSWWRAMSCAFEKPLIKYNNRWLKFEARANHKWEREGKTPVFLYEGSDPCPFHVIFFWGCYLIWNANNCANEGLKFCFW